jgi:hypothetical protein
LNRLITTFDEVPPISTRASQRKYHGVTFETCNRRSLLVRSQMQAEAHTRDPQGLRRPRFSFFIFTCQTAWDRNPALV